MKRFLTQVMRLFRKSKVGSQEVQNWLETARRGAWLGISWWLEGGAGLRVLSCMGWYLRCLNFSLATKEGAPRLSYQFSLMWDRRGRRIGVVGFGSDCHQTSKMELNLYYIYIYILFMLGHSSLCGLIFKISFFKWLAMGCSIILSSFILTAQCEYRHMFGLSPIDSRLNCNFCCYNITWWASLQLNLFQYLWLIIYFRMPTRKGIAVSKGLCKEFAICC